MKKLLIALALILGPLASEAQVKTPQASPKGHIKQTVGLTDVEVTIQDREQEGEPCSEI